LPGARTGQFLAQLLARTGWRARGGTRADRQPRAGHRGGDPVLPHHRVRCRRRAGLRRTRAARRRLRGLPAMTPTRPGTWLRVLLIASLALNIAVVAGFAWHHFDARHDGWSRASAGDDRAPRAHGAQSMRGTMMPNPRVLRQVLPEERRVVVDALRAEHREQIRGNVREVFQARNEVHELLTAETVDAEAL